MTEARLVPEDITQHFWRFLRVFWVTLKMFVFLYILSYCFPISLLTLSVSLKTVLFTLKIETAFSKREWFTVWERKELFEVFED